MTILPDRLQEYMLKLEAIRPDLSSNEDEAIAAGQRVCAVAADPNSGPADVRAAVHTEFGGAAPLTTTQAQQLYDLVTEVVCPDVA